MDSSSLSQTSGTHGTNTDCRQIMWVLLGLRVMFQPGQQLVFGGAPLNNPTVL